MENDIEYLDVNRKSWNKRTELHIKSEFYDMASFVNGKTSLKEIELDLLEDISGKKILHLQCHFGQDTLSLARMGADVTGVDLSDKAIDYAQNLATELNLPARFICSDVYKLPEVLDEKFDLVFTSYGVLGWLPDMNKWAEIVAWFLKPGGKLILVEFHPVVWMFDDAFTKIAYNYFKDEAIVESNTGSYAQPDAPETIDSISWNHSLSEVMTSLLEKHLNIRKFKEFDFSPYPCFSGLEKIAEDKYQLEKFGNKFPMVYAVVAEKSKDKEL